MTPPLLIPRRGPWCIEDEVFVNIQTAMENIDSVFLEEIEKSLFSKFSMLRKINEGDIFSLIGKSVFIHCSAICFVPTDRRKELKLVPLSLVDL